jgi:hypothetical protein
MGHIDICQADVGDFAFEVQREKVIEIMDVCIIRVIPSMVFNLIC